MYGRYGLWLVLGILSLGSCSDTDEGGSLGPSAVQRASFLGLGDLPGGEFESVAHAVSADGIVGEGTNPQGNTEGWRVTLEP